MKKARFTQKQPLLKTFDSGNGVYVFICTNEKETTEETQQPETGSGETQIYQETVYEYDYNEFVVPSDHLEAIQSNPENYLDYEPEKSVEQQLQEQKEQLETQKLLIQYVAEMGDIYIPE
nr:hypothetical protein [uncultured Blautia sp.]